jgi:hypothetical protein
MGDLPHQNGADRGPAIGDGGRSKIVPLPLLRPRRPAAALPHPGRLVHLWGSRDVDARRNQAWDDLLVLVDRAWSWRDPDSIAELEARLVELGVAVEADWV